MDTITLRIVESGKTELLREKLHDQLLAHEFSETKVRRYKGVFIAGVFNDVKFSSRFVPRHLESEGWAQLDFHTWRIKTYAELVEWIFLLVGRDKSLLDFIISEMKIIRLDLCLDIYAPENFIKKHMYKVGAIVCTQYRFKVDSSYIGIGEEIFASYTKPDLDITDADLVIPPELNVKNLPYIMERLEHRLKGRKLPIRHIVDFPDLIDFKAFDKLRILVLNEHGLKTIPEEKKESLLSFITDYGIHRTRRELNSSRNFARTYGKFFDDHSELIREGWRKKIAKYFCK